MKAMSGKDTMNNFKLLIVAVFFVHVKLVFASWPLMPNLALAPAPSSSIWPGMRMMPAAGLAQASLIQPIAIRDMQLAYPVQPVNIGQFSPMGAEMASEHDIVQFHRNQHRRRMQRERERLRLREREREQRLRHMHRDMHLHPFASSVLRNERNRSNNNLLDSAELTELMNKNKGTSSEESNANKESGERMKSSSDDDFVLLQKLNNEHIKTTSRPRIFDDEIARTRPGGQMDMMPPDPPTKPVDIRRKTMASPNGEVTYITEMLYDVGDMNGNQKVTRPPVAPNYIPAPNDILNYPPTDDPRTAPPFHITLVPPASGVLSRPPEIPATEWPVMPTPPTPFRARSQTNEKTEQTEGSERRESNSFPTDNNSHRDRSSTGNSNFQTQNRHHHQTSRPNEFRSSSSSYAPSSKQSFDQQAKASSSPTTKEKTWKGSNEGLGAAAIAGIVIGSLVSITLLAGE